MPSSRPFIDPATGELEIARIISEAVPLAKLIGVFVAVSLPPYAVALFGAENTALGALLALLGDFILAVGAGVVLMYVIVRGIQLADE
ncbi:MULTISPECIES: hypothetical protein [Haloarcula]|uniref:hypothetical protein n=1 Tax=Haloarcula TaxID=2237 RepID=UPI000595531A|nr:MULTISPECIES: hypothetical protein [Haloarcula]AJF27217.1 hypothetical protein SG26_16500 [Haloarcula sp. CBA1115]KAA9406974.1 hypothetical protein Har1131_09215 [Haloarcula sp. CBA1131]KZX48762.1 hypothetical protein AV929_07335 [Haloarcula sp. K1]